MMLPPTQPKLYHITHVDHLTRIVADGGLVSERKMKGNHSCSTNRCTIRHDPRACSHHYREHGPPSGDRVLPDSYF